MDNGNPWGNPTGYRYTQLTVWLIRLGIGISHSRPLHPQTNGKEERFHRTLKAELLGTRWFATIAEVQKSFDAWREMYNHERPHEALGLEVPASRYRVSVRSYPEVLPPIEYSAFDTQTINMLITIYRSIDTVFPGIGGGAKRSRPSL